MAKKKSTVMAGSLDIKTSLYFIVVMNLILAGFYYAFASVEAMKFSAMAGVLALCSSLIPACGFPFAEAAKTASAQERNDFKTVLYLRLASGVLSFALCGVFALILAAAGMPISRVILGPDAPGGDVMMMYIIMILSAVYALISCGVNWLRGFYQGMGENDVDRTSQLVFCAGSYLSAFVIMVILVYGFHLNRTSAVYGLSGGLIIGQLLALGYYVLFDRLKLKKYKAMARAQLLPAMQKKKAFTALVKFAAPSLMSAVCTCIFILAVPCLFIRIAMAHGLKYLGASVQLGAFGWMIPVLVCLPLLAGHQVFEEECSTLASAGHDRDKRASAFEKMMIRYHAYALPVCFVCGCLAEQIVQLVYGSPSSVDLVLLLRILSAESLLAGLALMYARIMIVLEFGSESSIYLLIAAILRIGMMIALPLRFGVPGMFYTGIAALAVYLFLCISKISNRYHLNYVRIIIMVFRIALGTLAMNGVYALFKAAGLNALSTDKLFDGVLLIGMVAISAAVYAFILSLSGIHLKKPGRKKKKTK